MEREEEKKGKENGEEAERSKRYFRAYYL